MSKFLLTGLMTAALLVPAAAALADNNPNDSDRDHPGAFVKDSVVTAKVKSKLLAKHMDTLTHIKVDTDNQGVVWLSGRAPTKDAANLAEMIAKDTDGVRSVHNAIAIGE